MGLMDEYCCDRCESISSIYVVYLGYYDIPGISKPLLFPGVGWCSRCDSLTEVETIPTAEDIECRRSQLRERSKGGDNVSWTDPKLREKIRSYFRDQLGDADYDVWTDPILRLLQKLTYRKISGHTFDRIMASYDASEDYFLKRTSPPRCLRCGSSEIIAIEESALLKGTAVHPGCGGHFKRVEKPYHEFVDQFHPLLLDAKGIVIDWTYKGE